MNWLAFRLIRLAQAISPGVIESIIKAADEYRNADTRMIH